MAAAHGMSAAAKATANPTSRIPLCRADPELFFPERNRNTGGEAKRWCAGCRLRTPCLMAALDRQEPHGIWGGLTPSERADLLKRREVIANVTAG